jgi:cytochrome c oxidase assembly factor CtaG
MQWWCSAESTAWTWAWRPYVGVWLLMIVFIALYVRIRRSVAGDPATGILDRQSFWFGLGILSLWLALDWPIGPLGSGYLASVHMGQFLLVGMLAPLLILLGIPDAAFRRIPTSASWFGTLEMLTHPLIAFFVFNGVITITHWPSVVDALMVSQLGSFGLDMAWLAGGLIFWWPLISPVPSRVKFHPIAQMGYLGFNIVLVRPPMLILFYSEFPAYAVYELAPPIFAGASPVDDQQLAAGIMKIGSSWIVAAAMLVIFIRWHRKHQETHPA